MDSNWPAVFQEKQFWHDWVYFDEVQIKYPDYEFKFSIFREYELVLKVNTDLWWRELNFVHESLSEPILLGWNDMAHWHPYVFRWNEFEAICRCLARQFSTMPFPGIPLLLLHQFAPIRFNDDMEAIRTIIREAWQTLNLFSEAEIAEFMLRTAFVANREMYWMENPQLGWVMDGEFPYSLRVATNKEFPFKQFNQMVEASKTV